MMDTLEVEVVELPDTPSAGKRRRPAPLDSPPSAPSTPVPPSPPDPTSPTAEPTSPTADGMDHHHPPPSPSTPTTDSMDHHPPPSPTTPSTDSMDQHPPPPTTTTDSMDHHHPPPPSPTTPSTDSMDRRHHHHHHHHPPPSPTTPPTSPTTPTSPTSPTTPGHAGRRLPNIRIKKQYSKIFRIKTKILQNLGKADRTVDDVFDEYEINFNRQQTNANRLHKEVANYLRCCRALHGASKSLFETLAEVYEPEWVGHELLYAQAQNSDMLWTDFCHKLQDQTLTPLTAYQQQFPEFRKKIDKRGRKLVDYDSQRHQLENLQRAGRRDEYKIARSRDTLETARVTYEALNKELYDELPTLYDQRIPNVSSSLQALFAAEATVMAESSKVAKELEAIAEKLSKECAKGTYKVKRGVAPRPLSVVEPVSPKTINSPSMWYDGGAVEEGGNSLQSLEGNEGTLDITNTEENQDSSATLEHKESYKPILDSVERTPTPPPSPLPLESPTNDADSAPSAPIDSEHDTNNRPTISGPVTTNKEETGRPYEEIEFEDKKVNGTVSPQARTNGEVIGTKIPPDGGLQPSVSAGATTEGLPQGVLYRVRATYKYTREDVDEIGFEVGDTIQVVEYDDPEEQEEGWLTGIKEGTQEKGLFPANFTRPI
nr:bridging integrator 2-like isoform X3 [Procambarus clarkii]